MPPGDGAFVGAPRLANLAGGDRAMTDGPRTIEERLRTALREAALQVHTSPRPVATVRRRYGPRQHARPENSHHRSCCPAKPTSPCLCRQHCPPPNNKEPPRQRSTPCDDSSAVLMTCAALRLSTAMRPTASSRRPFRTSRTW